MSPRPVVIRPPTEDGRRLWGLVLFLAAEFGADRQWSLIGGLMVQLHGFENDDAPRPTTDIDVLGAARRPPQDPKTIAGLRTFQVAGGSQALRRTEVVAVSLDGAKSVAMRRPSLLGAILIKARVVAKRRDGKFHSDRQDLIRLLGYVEDPRSLAEADGLTAKERQWLRDVEGAMAFDDPALLELFPEETILRARQAFGLLAR